MDPDSLGQPAPKGGYINSEAQRLFDENLVYASKVANDLIRTRGLASNVAREEIISAAQEGLWDAARAFRDDGGALFTTFARYRIRGAIFDYLKKNRLRVPVKLSEVTREQAINELCSHGFGATTADLTDAQIAEKMRDIIRTLGTVHLMSEFSEDETPEPVDSAAAASEAARNEMISNLRGAISKLTERERQVIQLIHFEHLTVTECGAKLGIHKSNVSRAYADIIIKLRHLLGGGP